ncbi:phosphate/phosphite/phosphonate ABC transporter substrate-binding protein [Paenibacillus planticolens]|uniref:Phosphate/phosphite/phosphonate ABC transporter substrate-binding protein n=1 Tax=Paenibacillus planticolens TaxID=2654976 RepID=A0ABX1ZY35_9BACL|nr:phosphate/phosphite/phosphonate ABC transporter substrate-binding protein [Paenibacillus planticolens]NOV03980.1 phosphate/phosphite/phosphonate ABC transporter substrate-binding protein [Paenibacillus planticolens]
MKTLKTALCTFLLSMLFCFNNGLAMADNVLMANIVIDNQTLHLEVPPVNHQGTVMVPMRPIFEALNAQVTWNKEDQSIVAKKDNISVQLFIGSQFAYINKGAVVLSGVPYINNGNTMVPVRFIAETFGALVTWNSVDQKVKIVTSSEVLDDTSQYRPYSLDQNSAASSASFVPSELRIQFVPSQMAELLLAKAKPLEKMLSEQLEIPVEFSVNTDYNNVVKSMKAKTIDLSFLPPSYYVYAHDNLKAVDVLLQALRYGVETPTGKSTQELVDFYQAMFLVRADSPIQSIEDLKNKKIGWQSVTSAAGYVYPGYLLLKNGIDPFRNVTGEQFRGHDKAVQGLLNNKVDAVAVFQDIRTNMLKDYPNVMNDTRILAFSSKIPNDTISVRSDMHPEWRKKIQDAFIAIVNDPEGKKVIQDVFSHQGYTVSEDNKFEIVREVNEWLYDELNTIQKP